ncbi:MAG: VOC family protein [Sulfolobales archaeon]
MTWPMDHLHLAVRSIDSSITFYKEVLGFEVKSLESYVCLTPRGADRCIVYLEEDRLPYNKENYIYHFALLLPSRADLGALLEKVLDRWDNIEGYADHLVSEAVYIRDPDNIGIEIYSDRDKTRWARDSKGHVVMDTLPLDIDDLVLYGRRFGGRDYIPSGTLFGHIHLRGTNPGLAGGFYSDVLGMRLTGVWFGARFLAYGDYHHHVAINNWPIPTPSPGSGLKSYAVNLNDMGVKLENVQLISESLCGARGIIIDPNGFKIEIL